MGRSERGRQGPRRALCAARSRPRTARVGQVGIGPVAAQHAREQRVGLPAAAVREVRLHASATARTVSTLGADSIDCGTRRAASGSARRPSARSVGQRAATTCAMTVRPTQSGACTLSSPPMGSRACTSSSHFTTIDTMQPSFRGRTLPLASHSSCCCSRALPGAATLEGRGSIARSCGAALLLLYTPPPAAAVLS